MNIINNSQVLGSLGKDLVLNTLGKIYVRVGDRYYELDFRNKKTNTSEIIINDSESKLESDVLIIKNINDFDYPGDGKLVISLDGKFYITYNNRFKNITPKSNNAQSSDSPVKITELEDTNVIGKLYSDNLIIDFLSGDITAEDATIDNLTVNSLNVKNLKAPVEDRFIRGSGKLYIGPEISISKITKDEGFVYFYVSSQFDQSLFPIYSLVTNETESFIGEIVDVTYQYIKVRINSGSTDNTKYLILKHDYIEYHPLWGSFYNTLHNLRVGNVTTGGDYSEYEFLTIDSDKSITIKPGTLVKSSKDCTIKVIVDSVDNQYHLKANTLYLINKLNIIALTNLIYFFDSKKEFEEAELNNEDIAFIKETEQLYYKGLFVGNKNDRGLPDDFKIEGSQEGALIVRKDNLWQPSYDYATHQYVNDELNKILNNAPEALDTLGEIASVLEDNVNNIGDIIFSINEVSNKIDIEVKKLYEKINSQDLSSVVAILDTKATWSALSTLENELQNYVRVTSLKYAFGDFRIEMNQLFDAVNDSIATNRKLINNNFEIIEELKLIDGEFATTIEKITGTTEYLTESAELIVGKVEKLTETVTELDEYIHGLGLYYYIQVIAEDCIKEYVENNGSIGEEPEGSSITMTDVETYVTNQLSTYALKSWVSDNFAEKGSSGSGGTTDGTVDLSSYVTHTQLDSKGFITQSQTDTWYLKNSGSNTYSGDLTIAKGGHSGNLTVIGTITGQIDVVGGSDIRYKTIVEEIDITSELLDEIINAPLFNFKWDDCFDDKLHLGTSAQYWKNTMFKNTVHYDSDKDFNYLSYQTLAFGIGKVNSHILKSHEIKLSSQDIRIIELEKKVTELENKLRKYGFE